MGFFWDWSKIMIVTITILGLAIKEYINPVIAALLMVLYVIFRGAVRGSTGITKSTFWVFEVSFILLLFANILTKGGNAVTLFPLIIDLYSVALAWVIKLIIDGYISMYHGIIFIVAIIVLGNIGRYIGNFGVHMAARKTFIIGTPIAVLIVFTNLYGAGNALALLAQLLPLFILLFGFYIMFLGVSSSRRYHK